MSFGRNLRDIRRRLGLSQEELAERLHTSKQVISRYENGQRIPKVTVAQDYAEILECSLSELIGLETDSLPPSIMAVNDLHTQRIPLIGSVAAGVPILAEETYDLYVDGPAKADYALRVEGDSMTPTFLPGDLIYIRSVPDVDDGRIGVVLLDDSAAVKHIYHTPAGLMLTSDNPAYTPLYASPDQYDTIRILGAVIGYTRIY